jgi:hypothetical protein
MDNVSDFTALSQYLSLLPFDEYDLSCFDYRKKKLSTANCVQWFLAAYLLELNSSRDMETVLRAEPSLQKILGIESLSHSQVTRRLPQIPTELLQDLFHRLIVKCKAGTTHLTGLPRMGKLHIVDSTALLIPENLGSWARVSKYQTMVKMHVRLVVESPDVLYPEAIIPTTGNVSDRTVSCELVVAKDVLYLMDRGYVKYKRMDEWIRQGFHFVMRINEKHQANLIEEYPVDPQTRIKRDAKVMMGSAFTSMEEPIRLVEYYDEKGRLYRVVTTRMDLSAEEVAEAYRKRWIIELYFKWLKQRAALVKLYSYQPQALWNTMYLALIAYALMLIVKLSNECKRPDRDVWRTLQHFAFKPWECFLAELHRNPTRTSKGRQKGPKPETKGISTTVGMFKSNQ